MSELLDDLEVGFPKTVTACHDEIRRLGSLLADADAQIEAKDRRIGDLQDEVEELEEASTEDSAEDAINLFLDECERTGPLRFDVPQTDRVNRAIVGLHDVVGRNT